MLSSYQWTRGDWIGATEKYEEYSRLAPANVTAPLGNTSILGRTGRSIDASRVSELHKRYDPLSYLGALIRAQLYIQTGRYEDALVALADADRLSPPPDQGTALRRMFLAITLGEPEGIREALAHYAIADPRTANVVNAILDAIDSAPNVVLGRMRQIYENNAELTGEARMVIASMAAHYGDAEFALAVMADELAVNMLRIGRLWYPFFSDMRSLPGFKTLAENVGFVAYWRKYEWADTCRPLGDDDFECR